MIKITNMHTARIALAADFILDPGQSRNASDLEISKMNRPVLLGLVADGKLDAPEIKASLNTGAASVEDAKAAAEKAATENPKDDPKAAAEKAAAEKAAAEKAAAKKSATMPTPGK